MNSYFHSFNTKRDRRQGRLLWSFGLGLMLAWLAAGSAMAQGQFAKGVSARVSPAKIRAGGFAVLTVTVEGGRAAEMGNPTLPEGVQLTGPGKSTSSGTTIINGRISHSYSQSWQITAAKEGTYTIPAQTVEVDGKEASSNAVQLTVTERNDAEMSQFDPMLSIEVGKREFYVGEIVPITANLYVHRQTLLRRVGLIELPKDSFAIQRFPLQGEEGVTQVAGVPYRVLTFQSTLSGLKPGKFKLGPATSEIIVEIPTADNPFQHPMFSQGEPQKVRPPSNDVEVNVLPLPAEGRPKGFTGVVGDFEMNMTAEPVSLAVGEPISVEVTINGSGNFDAIVAPQLTQSGEWKVYPAKRFNMGSPDVMLGGTTHQIGFNQVIIPQKQVTEVPSYEFSFFSPTKKQYVTLRTPPVPLQVKPAANAAPAPEAVGSVAPSELQPEKVPQAAVSMTDILGVTTASPVWLATRPLPWRDPRFLTGNAVAGGLLVLMLLGKGIVVLARRSASAPDAAVRALWKEVKMRQQPAGQFYHNAARLIAAQGLSGPEVGEVLTKAEQFNYSMNHEGATEPVAADERARVLQVLQEAGKTKAAQG